MYAWFKKAINVDIRKSRFKKKLLEKAPELTEITTSNQRDLLVYKEHIGDNINVNKNEEMKMKYMQRQRNILEKASYI